MGETERKSRKRSGGNILIIMAAVMVLAVIGVAIYIAPQVKGTVAEYKKQAVTLHEVRAELRSEEEKRDAQLEKKRLIEIDDDETETIKNETFKLAAGLEADIKAGKNKNKICYLTIDDGPYYRGKKLLEILNKYDVKASFFLSTANGDKLPDKGELSAASMYPEYLRYGHTIGNHSYSHDYGEGGIYKSVNAFMKDIKKQEEFTEKATAGYRPQIVRFPGGRATAGKQLEGIEEALREENYGWVDWTVDSGDSWGSDQASPATMMQQIKKAAKDQDIMVILCHEWSKDTEKVLPEMIEYLQGKGYIFLPLFYDSQMVYK